MLWKKGELSRLVEKAKKAVQLDPLPLTGRTAQPNPLQTFLAGQTSWDEIRNHHWNPGPNPRLCSLVRLKEILKILFRRKGRKGERVRVSFAAI